MLVVLVQAGGNPGCKTASSERGPTVHLVSIYIYLFHVHIADVHAVGNSYQPCETVKLFACITVITVFQIQILFGENLVLLTAADLVPASR